MNLYERTGLIRTLLLATFLGLVAGCSSNTIVKPDVTQKSLLVKCADVLPSDYPPTGQGWMLMAKEWSSLYHECRIRHNGLVDIVKDTK